MFMISLGINDFTLPAFDAPQEKNTSTNFDAWIKAVSGKKEA